MPSILDPGARCKVCSRPIVGVSRLWHADKKSVDLEFFHQKSGGRRRPPCRLRTTWKRAVAWALKREI